MVITPMQLPSDHHNPFFNGCAHDTEENKMQEENLVDKI